MKIWSKVVSLSLTALMVCSALPLTAASAQAVAGNGGEQLNMVKKGNFFKITTSSDFRKGVMEGGVSIDSSIGDGALKLMKGAVEGSYLSPVYKVSAFTAMTPTWDADTPNGSSIELQGRVFVDQAAGWSKWMSWGRFGQSIQRGSGESDLGSDGGIAELTPDELLMKTGGNTASRIQYRVVLRTSSPSAVPDVRLISSAMKNSLPGQGLPCFSEYPVRHLPAYVDLVGYPYSQMRRDVVPFVDGYAANDSIGGSICSMTTMTGMINFKGQNILPEELALNFRDMDYGFGNWPYSVAAGASFGYEAYMRYGNWGLIQSELAHGNPVGVSVKYTNVPADATADCPYVAGAPLTTSGHLVLIRGYKTAADGTPMVLVNDSAVNTDAEAARAYRVDQFITGYVNAQGDWVKPAWGNSVCYILHNKEANAGRGSIQRVRASLKTVENSANAANIREYQLRVNGRQLSLPADFTTWHSKAHVSGQGGVITVTADKADGRSLDGTKYPTAASKPATYGTVSQNGDILVDLTRIIPQNYTLPVKVTFYVIFNNGVTYVATDRVKQASHIPGK